MVVASFARFCTCTTAIPHISDISPSHSCHEVPGNICTTFDATCLLCGLGQVYVRSRPRSMTERDGMGLGPRTAEGVLDVRGGI